MIKKLLFLLFSAAYFLAAQDFSTPYRYTFQQMTENYTGRYQFLSSGGTLYVIYNESQNILMRTSSDGGLNWTNASLVTSFILTDPNQHASFAAVFTQTGRLLILYSAAGGVSSPTKVIYSDNNGSSWSLPLNIIGSLFIEYPSLAITPGNDILASGGTTNHLFRSTDNGLSWTAQATGFRIRSLAVLDNSNFFAFSISSQNITGRRTTDAGSSWGTESVIADETDEINYLAASVYPQNKINLIYSVKQQALFPNVYQKDLFLMTTTDNGINWSSPYQLTRYKGDDAAGNFYSYDNNLYVNFISDRWGGYYQIYGIKTGVTSDDNSPPVVVSSDVQPRERQLVIKAMVDGYYPVTEVKLIYILNEQSADSILLYDDGLHEDGMSGDQIWGVIRYNFDYGDQISYKFSVTDSAGTYINTGYKKFVFHSPEFFRWLSAGSLHNWYSSYGAEREESFFPRQQYGLRYPAELPHQDMQASKGFWMGVKDFTDENNLFWKYRVLNSGPRVSGKGDFWPVSFYSKAKFPQPEVYVNGEFSPLNISEIDIIDPDMKADFEIVNEFNTALGISVKRRIFQFSHPLHDNYIVQEYTFKNTGNTDGDSFIELPANNISGLNLLYLYRWAINASTRYVIGNPTGWGINTMLDVRGTGNPDPPGENFRTQFAWHGYTPFKEFSYDNIGGPIWHINSLSLPYLTPDDTIGRLGAVQFTGVMTLHAAASAANNADDPQQPKTTKYIDSDSPLLLNYNSSDTAKMRQQYDLMMSGHSGRHAIAVEQSGDFAVQTNSPALGTSGGFSALNSYGPYNLSFGDSIKIIWVEGAASISREEAINTGRKFKRGEISAYEKNVIVLTGKDSLMLTWQRAVDNYSSDFVLPELPLPPSKFFINGTDNKINLSWETFDNDRAAGYRIYRSMFKPDSLFMMIAEVSSDVKSYTDSLIVIGRPYKYYLSSVNSDGNESSRYYTLSSNFVYAGILGGGEIPVVPAAFTLYQNYPNPFNPVTLIKFNIPSRTFTSLKVYDILGKEAAELVNAELEAGSYERTFNGVNLASGMYIYILKGGSYVETKKMLLLK
jgi:hypothetical protein